ncbi:MAG: AraC family transcriptional regulator [Burkholderiaceae bacterium]
MAEDPLSDVLRSVQLRAAVFFHVSCRDDWAAQTPSSDELRAAVNPQADHVLAYHLVLRGSCWAATDGEAPARIDTGGIVMFPRGDAHVLSGAPGREPPADQDDGARFQAMQAGRPLRLALRNGKAVAGDSLRDADAETLVICGFVSCSLRPFNPLIRALPRLVHLSASGVGAWVAPMLEQAVSESIRNRAGSEAVLERVSEMVFVDAARRYLESIPEDSGGSGWFAALRDRHVGRALALLHSRAAEPWTVEELSRQVGLSRSALHERFEQQLGQPPMQYLANWRMQLGANLLRAGDAKVAQIAQEVGYESEAAFARAFKRLVGQPPAAWRRSVRQAAG